MCPNAEGVYRVSLLKYKQRFTSDSSQRFVECDQNILRLLDYAKFRFDLRRLRAWPVQIF